MTTATTTLADWLLERLAEDEAVALAASNPPWVALTFYPTRSAVTNETEVDGGVIVSTPTKDDADATHIARHDPARVLREVAAKRSLVLQYVALEDVESTPSAIVRVGLFAALREFASVYAGAPGWREEWAL